MIRMCSLDGRNGTNTGAIPRETQASFEGSIKLDGRCSFDARSKGQPWPLPFGEKRASLGGFIRGLARRTQSKRRTPLRG